MKDMTDPTEEVYRFNDYGKEEYPKKTAEVLSPVCYVGKLQMILFFSEQKVYVVLKQFTFYFTLFWNFQFEQQKVICLNNSIK